ncbi:hypothetical protein GGI25_004486 [Coemansia spiralis]|uniref:BZIP domain-containing protein n=2 Tax=Coemansia TaxID=4863 RepID=A0A9W8KWL4_9FUNG|nr:hypothetical protein EDC05_005238 [Coemansia umbellata]KAJ2619830.1 hypothetical protein GGI26_005504 [Coemansia sp. RSA 1358]KAJ2674001.1 hypothetical protein GGI25_004486 [Coemansia spiralis]
MGMKLRHSRRKRQTNRRNSVTDDNDEGERSMSPISRRRHQSRLSSARHRERQQTRVATSERDIKRLETNIALLEKSVEENRRLLTLEKLLAENCVDDGTESSANNITVTALAEQANKDIDEQQAVDEKVATSATEPVTPATQIGNTEKLSAFEAKQRATPYVAQTCTAATSKLLLSATAGGSADPQRDTLLREVRDLGEKLELLHQGIQHVNVIENKLAIAVRQLTDIVEQRSIGMPQAKGLSNMKNDIVHVACNNAGLSRHLSLDPRLSISFLTSIASSDNNSNDDHSNDSGGASSGP